MVLENNPVKKLKCVKKIFSNIEQSIADLWQKELGASVSKVTIDADCFFPIFIYAIIKAGVPTIESHFRLVEEFTSTISRDGFDYINCALSGCVEHILSLEPRRISFTKRFDEMRSVKSATAAVGRQSGSVIDSVASSFMSHIEERKCARFSEDVKPKVASSMKV